jgi:hypothetical protein
MEMNDNSFDDLVRQRIRQLNNQFPVEMQGAEILWETILVRKKKRDLAKRIISYGIAASVLLLMTAGFLWQRTSSNSVENEMAVREHLKVHGPSAETETLAFLKKLCEGDNISCHSPAFHELRAALDESFARLKEIDDQLLIFRDDANLIRARTQAEQQKTRIMREMVLML